MLNLFMAIVFMLAGIIGNGTIRAYATENQPNNLISNGTFEDGSVTGWNPRGSVNLEATTDDKASGNYSMKVTGRTINWSGPTYALAGKVSLGKTYSVSLKVKALPGQAEADKKVHVSTERKIDGSTSYPGLKRDIAINDTTWTTIETDMSLIGVTGDLTKLDLYVESPSNTLSFYVDDVSVVEVSQEQLSIQNDIPSLKDVFKAYFPLGGAVEPTTLTNGNLSEQLVKKHYNVIVPGNQMKPDAILYQSEFL